MADPVVILNKSISSQGMELEVNGISVEGLSSIGIPGITKDENDTTTHSSEGYKETDEGLADCGTVEVSGNLWTDDAGQTELRRLSKPNMGKARFVVRTPEQPRPPAQAGVPQPPEVPRLAWSFIGWISAFSPEPGEVGGVVKFSCSIRISGGVTEDVLPFEP